MANVAKFTRSAAGHICKHYERARDDEGNYLKFGNQEIDPTRTPLNYNLGPDRGGGQMDFIQNRCSEVVCMNRKDVNVMCSWIVTAPAGIAGTENEREFFDQTYNFLSEKYGQENIISAHVHKDEVTPHLHFAFVPVVHDKKRDRLKVSAKECITRKHLQSFHTELDRYLEQTMGERYQGGILNNATKDGNRSIEELKRASATAELKELQQIEQETRKRVNALRKEANALEGQIPALTSLISKIDDIIKLDPQKTITGAIKGVSVDDIEDLKKIAIKYHKIQPELAELRKEKKKFNATVQKLKEQANISIKERIQHGEMQSRVYELEDTLDSYKKKMGELVDLLIKHGLENEIHQRDPCADQQHYHDYEMEL